MFVLQFETTDANVGEFLDWVMNRQATAFGGGTMAIDDFGPCPRGRPSTAAAAADEGDVDLAAGDYDSPDYSYSGSEDEEEDGDEAAAGNARCGGAGSSGRYPMVCDGCSGESQGSHGVCMLGFGES